MQLHSAIYLDYNATTPVDPEVMNAMLPYFVTAYGNPSSADHIMGWQAKEVLEDSRIMMAKSLHVNSKEIFFTAGATESINLAIRGLIRSNPSKRHIITVKSEHSAVLDTCMDLLEDGVDTSFLNVDKQGIISTEDLRKAIREDTLLVSVMWVNNETGVLQPIEEIASICRDKDVIMMSDATQAIGKLALEPKSLGIDILVGSAHKIYGPKGVGFLYLEEQLITDLQPIITGGGQESKKRAGTINLSGIVGLVKAVEVAYARIDDDSQHIRSCRDRFEEKLSKELAIVVNGAPDLRLYNTSNICLKGYDSDRIMQIVGNKLAASRGSACSTGDIKPSHVLAAMGLADHEAHAAIRFSFGRFTTLDEVDKAIELLINAVKSLS